MQALQGFDWELLERLLYAFSSTRTEDMSESKYKNVSSMTLDFVGRMCWIVSLEALFCSDIEVANSSKPKCVSRYTNTLNSAHILLVPISHKSPLFHGLY